MIPQGYSTNEECTKWPITKCTLEKKMVKKYTPETNCKKVPFELCGPAACPVEPGAEQCFDKTETVILFFDIGNHNSLIPIEISRKTDKILF